MAAFSETHQKNLISPPRAEKIPKKLVRHGDTRLDNYFWMRERDSKKVLEHLEAENKYVDSIMKPTEGLQQKIIAELRSRIKEADESAPYRKGDYYFSTKFEQGAEYPIFLRRKGSPSATPEVLLNVNLAAKGQKYFDVARVQVSYNEDLLGYSVDTVGRRFFDIHFKDLKSGNELKDVLTNTTGNFVWLNDNKTILYTQQDPDTLRSYRIFKYTLGDAPKLVYEEKDPQFFVSLSKDITANYVYLNLVSNSSTEVRYADANDSDVSFKIFAPRKKKHEYSVLDGEDCFYVLTNLNAKNFKLVQVSKANTSIKKWKTIVPHKTNSLLEEALILKNHIVLQERVNGLIALTHMTRDLKKKKRIKFPEDTYMAGLGPNAQYDSDEFRYEYESLTLPESTYDYSLVNQKSTLIKQREVPGFDPSKYKSERVFARAKDGTKVPISILYRKDKFKKGKNPLYIYSYGSYGLSTDPYFRSGVITLVDRGFVYAIPHIRGGSDMGRAWYENGKLLKKKNTFTDFIDSTLFLLKKGYGKAGHVYAMGGSAGGLLMGAILNMRPDLYNGVIAAVPFVDVVTTMLDDSIPLTTNEYEEWGNPNEKKYYKYIKSYSPYDNVKPNSYPNILVTTGYHDSQVQYWEPAKWVAKIREMNKSKNLILFKTDMASGHSGTTGRFESLKEDALDYAFFLMLEGME